MHRFIIVNPDREWIQGDITGKATPEEAVRSMLASMNERPGNASWLVYRAPAGFPEAVTGYSVDDKEALRMLRSNGSPSTLRDMSFTEAPLSVAS